MLYSNNFNCPKCQWFKAAQVVTELQHNGVVGTCQGCGTRYARHLCQKQDNLDSWLPILEEAATVFCPGCGITFKVLDAVETLNLPFQWKEALKSLAAGIAVVAILGVLFGDNS